MVLHGCSSNGSRRDRGSDGISIASTLALSLYNKHVGVLFLLVSSLVFPLLRRILSESLGFSLRSPFFLLFFSIVCRPLSPPPTPKPTEMQSFRALARVTQRASIAAARAQMTGENARQTDRQGAAQTNGAATGQHHSNFCLAVDGCRSCSNCLCRCSCVSASLQLPPSAPSPCRLCDAPLCTHNSTDRR